MEKITLLSTNKTEKVEVLKVLEQFYLEQGFVKINKDNYFLNLKIKIRRYFHFFRQVKITFNKAPKKKYILYDTSNFETLKYLLPKEETFLLPVRITDIKILYLSLGLFFYVFFNFFKNSLKQNYLTFLIKKISPKAILTAVELSTDFYITAKILKKDKIKFIAIQHSCLRATDYLQKTIINKSIFIPKFYCFGSYEKEILQNTNANIGELITFGSLKAAIFLKNIKKKNITKEKNNFDICLISEPAPYATNDVHGYDEYQEIPGKIAKFTHDLCEKRNLNLVFPSKFYKNSKYFQEEYEYYKYFLKNNHFELIPKDNFLSTLEKAYQSNVIIGHSSTALREIFSLEKKVLQWNFSKNIYLVKPFSGSSYLEGSNYENFEKRILNLLELTYGEYQNKIDKKTSIANNASETISMIEKDLSMLDK